MIAQMRMFCTCFSVLQGPKNGLSYFLKGDLLQTPTSGILSKTFHSLNRSYHGIGTFEHVGSNSSMSSSVNQIIPRRSRQPITKVVGKPDLSVCEGIKYQAVLEMRELNKTQQRLIPIIAFDIETTGFNRKNERIIEIALRDLRGGHNGTFTSLINPEKHVGNSDVHHITTEMTSGPGIPRFKELLPILLHYVKSRQVPNLPILFVAHNAYSFDVPFLKHEFGLCSEDIPSDWLFLDTLPLARELKKQHDPEQKPLKSLRLGALREYYDIPLDGEAHRAQEDVNVLTEVLQKMTHDLKITKTGLLERSFKASDLVKKCSKSSSVRKTSKRQPPVSK